MSVMLDAGAGSVLNDGEMEFLVISNIWPKQVNLSWQDVELMVPSNDGGGDSPWWLVAGPRSPNGGDCILKKEGSRSSSSPTWPPATTSTYTVHTNTVTTHIQSILAFLCANEASKKLYDISNPPLTLSIDNSHN